MLRVVMMLMMKGKRQRGKPRLKDNIDSHLEGKSTFLKDVLETKCFKNRHDRRTLLSRSTDWSYGVDHCAPISSMVSR